MTSDPSLPLCGPRFPHIRNKDNDAYLCRVAILKQSLLLEGPGRKYADEWEMLIVNLKHGLALLG